MKIASVISAILMILAAAVVAARHDEVCAGQWRQSSEILATLCIKGSTLTQAPTKLTTPDQGSNRPEQRAEIDLQAQVSMARWAYWMLWVSAVGVIVGAIGIFYLAATLRAARQANEGFRWSAERQLRAYITIHQASYVHSTTGRPPGCTIRIVNSGSTPANNSYAWYRIGIRPIETLEPRENDYSADEHSSWDKSIGPGTGGTISAELGQTLTQQEYLGLTEKRTAIVMWGEVHYKDVFNQQQVTKFCYFRTGNPNSEIDTMSAWKFGNAAT
tara:strand:+ start:423 stop:1241 length:819 start_codon:yes stop_codon:yes gene_type:complete